MLESRNLLCMEIITGEYQLRGTPVVEDHLHQLEG
jgi:hypothetical protein